MKKVASVEWLIRLTIVLLLFLSLYLIVKLAPIWRPMLEVIIKVLIPFFVAALFAYLLRPPVEALHRRRIPRPIAILFIYVVFFGLLGLGFVKGVPYLIKQLKAFEDQIPEFVGMYRQWIQNFYDHTSNLPEAVHDHFRGLLRSVSLYINQLIQRIIHFLMDLVRSIIPILMVPVLVFYFLNDFAFFQKAGTWIIPRKWHAPAKRLLVDIDESLGRYIRGQLLVCLVLAGIAIIVLGILNVPYFAILGTIIGVTDIIPYFGPIIGAVPVLLVAATVSWRMVIYVAIFIVVIQFIEGNLLSPLIVGKSLRMHPIVIIFVIFLGGEVGGLLGLLVAVPFFAVLREVYIHVRAYIETRD